MQHTQIRIKSSGLTTPATSAKRMVCCALALFANLFIPAASQADDEDTILGRFTHSITNVYIASESCKNTLSPGPMEYTGRILDFINQLYPGGVAYWVIPESQDSIKDYVHCMNILDKDLWEYNMASREFQDNYPDKPTPPVLVAYHWEKKNYDSIEAVPTPSPSYTPPSRVPGPRQAYQ